MCDMNSIRWISLNLSLSEVRGKRVLDVGAYDVNGSVRSLVEMLEPEEYLGVDIQQGPGVDIVCRAENLAEELGEDGFDLVLSFFMLEHVRDWRGAVSNMKRVCRPGGVLIIAVPHCFPFHGYPSDFWRYSRSDIREIFSDCDLLVLEEIGRRTSLVFAKIAKKVDFVENALGDLELYSILRQKRVREVEDADLRTFRGRYLGWRSRVTRSLVAFAKSRYGRLS